MTVPQPAPVASRVKAPWLARLRGLLAVPVAVALVLGAPGLAFAAFTAKTTAALTVGTYKVPAPASINGTLECTSIQGKKGASISFTSFATVDRATGYTAIISSPNDAQAVSVIAVGDTSHGTTLLSKGNGRGTYTFTLTASVGLWTGEPLTQSVTC